MKLKLLLAMVFILLATTIYSTSVNAGPSFTDTSISNYQHNVETNYSAFVSGINLNYCWIEFIENDTIGWNTTLTSLLLGANGYCENISINTFDVGKSITVRFWVNESDGDLNYSETSFISEYREQGLNLVECPDNIPLSLMLLALVFIFLFFQCIALIFNYGFMGFFASLLQLFTAFVLAGCMAIYGMILASFSIILIIWFVIKGFNLNK